MARLSSSEKYALISVVALLAAAILNIPALTLSIALVGLPVGLFLLRREALTRAGVLAIAGFTVAGLLALFALIR